MKNPDPIIHDLEIMNNAKNYHRWFYSQFSKYLGQRIVEIGAGIGNEAEMLLDRNLVVSVDTSENCVEYMKRRFAGHSNILPLNGDVTSKEILGLRKYHPDTIICVNVLEHVKDDNLALSHMFELLGQNGKLILGVPAFQFLFGSIDRVVGHHRRYNKNELKEKLADARFKVLDIFYMNSISLFGWFLNNRILKLNAESLTQVKFFDTFVVPWLSVVERAFRPPFGLSIVAIAEKETSG
jgi:SAM-dependent methyltransferase